MNERQKKRKPLDRAMLALMVNGGQLHQDWADLLTAAPPPPSERPKRNAETKSKWRDMFGHLQQMPGVLKYAHTDLDTLLRNRFGLRMGQSVYSEGLWIFASKVFSDEIEVAESPEAELGPVLKMLGTFSDAQRAQICTEVIKGLAAENKKYVLENLTRGINGTPEPKGIAPISGNLSREETIQAAEDRESVIHAQETAGGANDQ